MRDQLLFYVLLLYDWVVKTGKGHNEAEMKVQDNIKIVVEIKGPPESPTFALEALHFQKARQLVTITRELDIHSTQQSHLPLDDVVNAEDQFHPSQTSQLGRVDL